MLGKTSERGTKLRLLNLELCDLQDDNGKDVEDDLYKIRVEH